MGAWAMEHPWMTFWLGVGLLLVVYNAIGNFYRWRIISKGGKVEDDSDA